MSTQPSLFAELQRRHVYKVGAAYAVAGWLLVQVATQVFPFFDVPNAAVRWVVIAVVAGFPVALVLAWLFDLTPQGIVRTDSLPASDEAPAAQQERRGMDRKLNYVLGVLLLLAVGYVILDHALLRRSADVSVVDAAHDKSIAVLPFENLSDDKANAYFAIGIQDEILTRLAKLGSLRVISRSSTANLAAKPDDLAGFAKRLGADSFLEGSVQKIGDAVHINVQLIRAATSDHLWAETYDRKLDRVFEVEGEVAQAIAQALDVRLSGAEHRALNDAPTRNPQAYDAYLRGLAYEHAARTETDDFDAVRQYQQAVDLDPSFALAWAHLAIAHSGTYFNFIDRTPARLQQMQQAADTAVKLQPGLGEAWLARGYYYYRGRGDYPAALADFERASALLPNDAEAIAGAAYVKRRQGRFGEALADIETAVRRDPRNLVYWTTIAETRRAMYRFDSAHAALGHATDISPDNPRLLGMQAEIYLAEGQLNAAQSILDALPADPPDAELLPIAMARTKLLTYQHRYPELVDFCNRELAGKSPPYMMQFLPFVYQSLGAAYLYLGKPEDARATFERGSTLALDQRKAGSPDVFLSYPLGMMEAGLGHRDAALEEVDRLAKAVEDDAWIRVYMYPLQAQIQLLTGDKEAALASLSKTSIGLSLGDLRFNPVWDPIRADPRFQKVMEGAKPSIEAKP